MPDLDAIYEFAGLDKHDMLGSIASFPDQCDSAWRRIRGLQLPASYGKVAQVMILGMGGSAIGGDLLRTLVSAQASVPILVHRDYVLPGFVGPDTVVIVCSYSGDTEEAIVGLEQAVARKSLVLAMTTGGELARRSQASGIPLCQFDFQTQPRAALGHLFTSLLGTVQSLGLVEDQSEHLTEAIRVMRDWQSQIGPTVPVEQNSAKSLARRLQGRLPVVYAAEHLSEVGRRWKGQFNENSKSWAVFDTLPELNHNTVAGYHLPAVLSELAYVLMLTSTQNHPRVRARFDITEQLLQREQYSVERIAARGDSLLAQMLSLVHFGDYVSYYLAMLNGVDPWAIGDIEFIKGRLGHWGR